MGATLSEFELIERFFQRRPRSSSVVLAGGDDAALIAPTPGFEMALSVDMLVEGRHFFADVDPRALGHKTLAANLSDMAAMGATPRWALLAGALPAANAQWLEGFARGFFDLADAHGVDLVGGDTTHGPLNLCVTIAGEVPTPRSPLPRFAIVSFSMPMRSQGRAHGSIGRRRASRSASACAHWRPRCSTFPTD